MVIHNTASVRRGPHAQDQASSRVETRTETAIARARAVGRRAGRCRRPCPRCLRGDDGAHRRARDAAGVGQKTGAERGSAPRTRLDRSRCAKGLTGTVSWPRDCQLDQHGKRPRAHRRSDAARSRPRSGRYRDDHRRSRHGQVGGAKTRSGAADLRDRGKRVRAGAGVTDLRSPDLSAFHG